MLNGYVGADCTQRAQIGKYGSKIDSLSRNSCLRPFQGLLERNNQFIPKSVIFRHIQDLNGLESRLLVFCIVFTEL